MSAVVYIKEPFTGADNETRFYAVEVPQGNHARVNDDGHLVIETRSTWGKEQAGLFTDWDHVVIDQRWLRGSDGRFISKER